MFPPCEVDIKKKKKPKHHELVSEAVRVFDEKLAIVLCFLITL